MMYSFTNKDSGGSLIREMPDVACISPISKYELSSNRRTMDTRNEFVKDVASMGSKPESPGQEDPGSWLLVSDLDETLTGDDIAFRDFCHAVKSCPPLVVVLNSSRPLASVLESIRAFPEPFEPDGLITAMGTEVVFRGEFDSQWQLQFGEWERRRVDRVMEQLGATPHRDEVQTPFKASYAVPGAALQEEAHAALAANGQPDRIIASGESDFDVLPPGAGKGAATLYVAERFGVDPLRRLMVAGDSRNDLEMFEVSARGILVGNAREELRLAVDPARSYQAKAPHAAGVLEGLEHWGVPLDVPSSITDTATTR